jgi:hypothetical protein
MTFDIKEVEISEKGDEVAVYCRVSSDEQRDRTSIEMQEDFLSDYGRGIALPGCSSACRTARDKRKTMRVEARWGRIVRSVS